MNVFDKIQRDVRRWRMIKNADDIIYSYLDVKAKDNRVNLHVFDVRQFNWSYYDNGKYPQNLGDYLAYPICQYMLDKRGLRLDQPIKGKKHLITVGSGGLASHQNATMWGTGITYDGLCGEWWEKYWDAKHRKLDLRAVRGPLSRGIFMRLGHNCPEIYGDPAILMPLIYTPKPEAEKLDYCIIPQYITEVEVRRYFPADKIISMNSDDYKSVIDRICSCSVVYSSSLHGIILAEAYGVPAVFYRGSGIPEKVDFKYRDYYAGTGRFDVPLSATLVEAMKCEPLPLPKLDKLQQGLMDVFPYDLWES